MLVYMRVSERLNCHHALLINLFARECMCGSNYDTGLGVGDGRTYVSTYTFYFLKERHFFPEAFKRDRDSY